VRGGEKVLYHSCRWQRTADEGALPKQFLLLAGRPVLMHTVERFSTFDPLMSIICCAAGGASCVSGGSFAGALVWSFAQVVAGGEERFHSVKAGLDWVAADMKGAAREQAVPGDAGAAGLGLSRGWNNRGRRRK
jgi:2-C-methyl-D-erythritol 4-phosphate cytidylyltransferase